MLEAGHAAPTFELPDSDMNMASSEHFLGSKNLVLFFYPKDSTPGCTLEAIEFSDLIDQFTAMDTLVFGISMDNFVSHAAFRDEQGLAVTLLSDIDGAFCEAYGVWQERERNGEKRKGIIRSTFVVDKQGIIRHSLYDVKPKGHAMQVLELVKGFCTGGVCTGGF
ncbi:MAG: peroxiredoxin [Gammaproteobacteria bacterium]|nr:peroxiredoxin [Gammaproteobacteria bacterium]MBU1655574.1 peroxiredoxin [Gammaproteobacteria bacterium]MBU1960271.1 peroxiredoxin [Gammaproteobacteria bacterium]